MKLSELNKYSFCNQLIRKSVGETTLFYNPDNGDMYEMNESTVLLIDWLEKGRSGLEILKEICLEYDVSAEEVQEDLDPILDRLIELNLLKII